MNNCLIAKKKIHIKEQFVIKLNVFGVRKITHTVKKLSSHSIVFIENGYITAIYLYSENFSYGQYYHRNNINLKLYNQSNDWTACYKF